MTDSEQEGTTARKGGGKAGDVCGINSNYGDTCTLKNVCTVSKILSPPRPTVTNELPGRLQPLCALQWLQQRLRAVEGWNLLGLKLTGYPKQLSRWRRYGVFYSRGQDILRNGRHQTEGLG